MNISSAYSASFIAGQYATQSFDRRMATGKSSAETAHKAVDVESFNAGEFSKSGDSTEKEGSETYIPLLPVTEDEDTTVSIQA